MIAIAYPDHRNRPVPNFLERQFHGPSRRHWAVIPTATQLGTIIALLQNLQFGPQFDYPFARHIHILRQAQYTVGIVPHQARFDQMIGDERSIYRRHTDPVKAGPGQSIEVLWLQRGH